MFILVYADGYSFQGNIIDRVKKEKATHGGKEGSYFMLLLKKSSLKRVLGG